MPIPVASSSPTLVTPNIGVAHGTSLALGGAIIGPNALATVGNALLDSATFGSESTPYAALPAVFSGLIAWASQSAQVADGVDFGNHFVFGASVSVQLLGAVANPNHVGALSLYYENDGATDTQNEAALLIQGSGYGTAAAKGSGIEIEQPWQLPLDYAAIRILDQGATNFAIKSEGGINSFTGPVRLGNTYVATPQVGTGYVTIQDSTGTTYKVLVAA